jgi:O-antigen/teichoic acid export membrane protein
MGDAPPAAANAVSRARIEQQFRTNSGLIVATRIVTAGLSLVMVPILVSRIGVAGYGTWEALLALASLGTVFQLPISGTVVWRVADAYGQGDAAEIRRVARLVASRVAAA